MTTEIKTIEDINAALDVIAAAMADKGIESPRPDIQFKQGGRVTSWLHADSPIGGERCVQFNGDDATTVLADMLAHVAALKSEEDWRLSLWRKDVAKVSDDGHDLNLPDNVMAPLRASSQAMTENLLTVALRLALQDLIAASEVMQNTSGYYRNSSQQQISSTQWSAWCRQLKIAKLALEVTK